MPDNKWHNKMAVLIWQDERNAGNEQVFILLQVLGIPHLCSIRQTQINTTTKYTQGGRKGHHTSLCACAGVGVWPKAGELSLWNALSLQEGTEQSFDTAYYGFQPSYFSQDIPRACDKLHVDKLHVNKLQKSKDVWLERVRFSWI